MRAISAGRLRAIETSRRRRRRSFEEEPREHSDGQADDGGQERGEGGDVAITGVQALEEGDVADQLQEESDYE
jgi:hypothetical protein